MALQFKEDQTAPVSQEDVLNAVSSENTAARLIIIEKILGTLNEKRDSYSGILTSLILVIESNDVDLIRSLKESLIVCIVSNPMRYSGKMFLNKVLNRLITEKPLFVIDLFEQIILTVDTWSTNFKEEREVLKIQISAIKAIRRAENLDGGRETIIPEETIDQLCDNSIYKCDDSTKIDTLTLILESRSTTKPIDERKLNLFKLLMQDAIRLQEPALRQIFISQTNKLINRVIGSHRVINRDSKVYSSDFRETINSQYKSFLEWLITFCVDSIYCNAYFGSFVLTISTLKLLTKHMTYSEDNLSIQNLLSRKRCYDSVLCCLNDSFEDNKAQALDLLLSLPYNEDFICERNLELFESIAYQLVESVNPAHSLTCQYIFKLIIGLRVRKFGSNCTKNQVLSTHLDKLINIVEESVRDTEENFAIVLKSKPIYPKLTCIRALLDEIEVHDIEQDRDNWERLARRLVHISINACRAVSTIVCNLNPETIGHLPMDLKPLDVESLSKTLNVTLTLSSQELSTITSQMLLISGWKTIKECSLSMGSICKHFWWPAKPIPKDKFPGLKTKPILTPEDINRIIEFFDHYLRNLRHRGAFEQAYNGFLMVTRRVWHDEQFKKLLIENLEQIINDFKNEIIDSKRLNCLKAYVTRRSAGLPFIVQAILNSEHKHDSKTLRWVLDCLFEVLENGEAETYQKIHCLNILRALIKEHSLGEKVLPYVGNTFIIAMESSRSESFSIRNCANMLLKAAVDRTFGVNRLRDGVHRRNQLSFERFFRECPRLHSEMVRHLHDGLQDRKCLTTVHYVFVILFRLRTTLACDSNENYENIIKPFIDPILQIVYNCPDYKLRNIASRLCVRLEKFCGDEMKLEERKLFYKEHIRSIVSRGNNCNNLNQLHGALLLIRYWVESATVDKTDFVTLTQEIIHKILNDHTYTCSIKSVVMDLVESCCLKDSSNMSKWFIDYVFNIKSHLSQKKNLHEPHHETFVFKSITTLLISMPRDRKTNLGSFDVIIPNMIDIIKQKPNNVYSLSLQAALIRFLNQMMYGSEYRYVDELLEQLDMDLTAAQMTIVDKRNSMPDNDCEKEKLISFSKHEILSRYLREKVSMRDFIDLQAYSEFENSKSYSAKISNTLRSVELIALACKYYCQSDYENVANLESNELIERLKFLINFISDISNCDVKCLALLYSGILLKGAIKHKNLNELENTSWLRVLNDFSTRVEELTDGSCSLTLRGTCAEVLRLNVCALIEKRIKNSQSTMLHLFSALVKLCQDEDLEVRSASQNILISLRRFSQVSVDTDSITGSRLDDLIRLMIFNVFNPDKIEDINLCIKLLLGFIFNNSKVHTCFVAEDKESLFDKTKLNTFVDYVATIRSSLNGLELFFGRREKHLELVELNSLELPLDIKYELRDVDNCMKNDTGDYSWRLNMLNNMHNQDTKEEELQASSNEEIIDQFIKCLATSLDYFREGYKQLLTDTEYTYHELTLYRRIAVIKFIIQCTNHKLKNVHLIRDIQDQLNYICRTSCKTTLLYKCSVLINDIKIN